MARVQGKVAKISKRKVGNGFAYAFVLDGGDIWYRLGFDEPSFKEGYMVRFDDTPIDKYGVIDVSTLQSKFGEPVVNKASPKQAFKGGGNKGGGGGSSENWEARQKYWEDKDKRDIVTAEQYNYRSAFHVAVDLINKGIELDILTVGTPKATKPKKWEAYLTQIDGLAADIHQKFLTVGDVPPVAEREEPPVDDDDDWEEKEEDKSPTKDSDQNWDDEDWDD